MFSCLRTFVSTSMSATLAFNPIFQQKNFVASETKTVRIELMFGQKFKNLRLYFARPLYLVQSPRQSTHWRADMYWPYKEATQHLIELLIINDFRRNGMKNRNQQESYWQMNSPGNLDEERTNRCSIIFNSVALLLWLNISNERKEIQFLWSTRNHNCVNQFDFDEGKNHKSQIENNMLLILKGAAANAIIGCFFFIFSP